MDHNDWSSLSKISNSLEEFLEILELSRKLDFKNKDECRNFLENIEQKTPITSHWFWEMIICDDECENSSIKYNSEENNNNKIFDVLCNEKEMQILIKDIKFQKQVKKTNKYIKIKYYLIIVLFIVFGILLISAANDLDGIIIFLIFLTLLIGIIYCLIGSFKEKKVYRKIKELMKSHLLDDNKEQFISYLANRINNVNKKNNK